MRKLVVFAALALALVLPVSAFAAHESNNKLVFDPVAGSSLPDASGSGAINYVKGVSGEEPDTVWTSAFRFAGLTPDATYTVVVRGRFADAAAFSGICTFTANEAGVGACRSEFLGLQRLAIAQLRLGSETGTPILQATRQAVVAGPGSITSDGGCREPDQAGATCAAPGQG